MGTYPLFTTTRPASIRTSLKRLLESTLEILKNFKLSIVE